MLALLPRRLTRQPQQPGLIDRSNPLTAGLSLLQIQGPVKQFDFTRGTNSAVVGTKNAPYVGGVGTGFGATFGVGSTDRVATPLALPLVERALAAKFIRNGPGGGNLGRLTDKTNGATGQFLYWLNSASLIVYGFFAAGAEQSVQIPGTGAAGVLMDVEVIHRVSGTTHTIIGYVNGVVAVSTTITGVSNDAAATVLSIGNRASDSLRNWDGIIFTVSAWERTLAPGEVAAVSANPWQLVRARQLPYFGEVAAAGAVISPGAGAVAIIGHSPAVAQTAHQVIAPGVGNVAVVGHAPAVVRTANQALTPGTGAVSITGYAPSVSRSTNVVLVPGMGLITITGYAPTVSQVVPGLVLANEYGATIIRLSPVNNAVPALVASIASLGGTMVATKNSATIMRTDAVNSTAVMRADAINQTAELL